MFCDFNNLFHNTEVLKSRVSIREFRIVRSMFQVIETIITAIGVNYKEAVFVSFVFFVV